jgi:hypothetical protein
MKATRQLISLCLVIGMTIASYTVLFFPPVSKGGPTTFASIQPYIYNTVNSGSGSKFLSSYYNTTTSDCIGNAFVFDGQFILKS